MPGRLYFAVVHAMPDGRPWRRYFRTLHAARVWCRWLQAHGHTDAAIEPVS